jgi:hypothetical protein
MGGPQFELARSGGARWPAAAKLMPSLLEVPFSLYSTFPPAFRHNSANCAYSKNFLGRSLESILPSICFVLRRIARQVLPGDGQYGHPLAARNFVKVAKYRPWYLGDVGYPTQPFLI